MKYHLNIGLKEYAAPKVPACGSRAAVGYVVFARTFGIVKPSRQCKRCASAAPAPTAQDTDKKNS